MLVRDSSNHNTSTTEEMDYSTLKTIKSQRDLADGIDLSVNYANELGEQEKIYSKYLNNNRVMGTCEGSEADEDDNRHQNHANHPPTMVTSTTISPNTITTKLPAQHETKFKLNFSVDRILGNEPPPPPPLSPANGSPVSYAYTKYSNCMDCPPNASAQSLFSMPFSVASMLNLNKAIVRPMPVRYLTRSPTVPLVHSTNLASAAAQNYAKYHHHHQLHSTSTPGSAVSASATNNNGGCTYKSHITRSPQRHPTGITVIDSPISSNANSKRKRSWSRAVFSQLQRKGLEIQFQIQKYITKPDRRKLAARLGLTDAQVKVWFQNRRMKWRHTRETKINQEKASGGDTSAANCARDLDDIKHETSSSSDEDDIDVVAE